MKQFDKTRLERRAMSGAADQDKIREAEETLRVSIADDGFAKKIKATEARAIALSGIDAQLAEKRRRAARVAAEDARYHEMMLIRGELQRQTAMERVEAARAQRMEIRKGMEAQMRSRETDKLVEMELKDQEGFIIQQRLEKMAADDADKAKIERQRRAAAMADLRRANAAALKMKQQKAAAEAHEDMRLAEMARIRRLVEEEELRKQEEAREAQNARFVKLAQKQQKLVDRRGDEDERRARRHREAKELADRRRAAAAEERQAAAKVEMLESLDTQIALKRRMMEQERLHDTMQRERAAVLADLALATEAERLERKKAESIANARIVREQMRSRYLAQAETKMQPFRERERATIVSAARTNLLAEQQKMAIQRLRKRGVPEVFVRDVAKLDATKQPVF
jgi:hypothetical protein